MKAFRIGIWSRLLLAFSFMAAITVLVAVMALLIFNSSGDLVEELAEKEIPQVVQVTELVRLSGEIIALAPNILLSTDLEARKTLRSDLDALVRLLDSQLQSLAEPKSADLMQAQQVIAMLEKNLSELQLAATHQSGMQRQLNRIIEKLRWLYADLIDEVDPLKQDYAYNLEADLERIVDAARNRQESIPLVDMQRSREAKESVERIRSNGVLLVSLMVQAAAIDDNAQIESLQSLAADTVALLRQDVQRLGDGTSTLTLHQLLEDMYQLASGEGSVFIVRHQLVSSDSRNRQILEENTRLIRELDRMIGTIVSQTEARAKNATTSIGQTLGRARTTLLFMVVLSLVTVGAVMWFYVRGSIVARLSALSRSMRAIARGDLNHEVPAEGVDEIGRMAIALRVFRDTALAVEEANAQAIIDNAGVGLILANPDGQIRFFNPEAERLFGVDAAAMEGTCLYQVVSEAEQQRFLEACRSILDTGEQLWQTTFVAVRADGTTFPVDIFIRRVKRRKRTGLMVTVQDVTERENAQELLKTRVREKTDHLSKINLRLRDEIRERRRLQDELVQAGRLAALGEFSAGIAHELNQPLSAIRYYLHNADKLLQLGHHQTHRDNLDKMGDLIERMAKMINHLKTFARYQSEQLVSVNLDTVVHHSLELMSGRLAQSPVQVSWEAGNEKGLLVRADEARLEQALVNIISNGIDAARSAGQEGRVRLSCQSDNDQVVILVCDNGPGISVFPPEKIFDPFVTTKEVGQGLGLGLSISYNIIKGFGGRMTAENLETGGACFAIYLKRAEGKQ